MRQMAVFLLPWGTRRSIFDAKCSGLILTNVLPTEGRKLFFKRVSKNGKKNVLRACGADEKERVARAIHKLKVAVHAVVPPVVLLEAKNAPGTSQSEALHGHMEGKRAEPDGQRSNRS